MPNLINLSACAPPKLRTLRIYSAVSMSILLSACSSLPNFSHFKSSPSTNTKPHVTTAEQNVLTSLVSQQDRLYRVAAPLLLKNSELCKANARDLLGFTAKNKYSYPAEYSEAAQQILGLNESLQITSILNGSGAAQSGLQRGDSLIAVDDKPFPQGPDAERQAASILVPHIRGRSSVKLTVARNGAQLLLNVPLTNACAFGIELGNTDNVIAYADSRRVMISRGMLNFVLSDQELAYVIAKEMAHNALGHPKKLRMSGTIGGIIDNLIRIHPDMSTMTGTAGVKAFSPEQDAAADKLSLYMLARANYNIDYAAQFWQRLASQYPPTVLNSYAAIHPNTAYRLSMIEKNVANLDVKLSNKEPLLP